MKELGRIRRLFYRDNTPIAEIARRTGHSRNTIRKWLRAAEGSEPKYVREGPPGKLTPFADWLVRALEADSKRPQRQRRTARKLHEQLVAKGFDGDYSRVTAFVRRWNERSGSGLRSAFVPLSFELGEAFQFDWSEEHLIIAGVWRKIAAAHLKLCASKAFVVLAYPSQSHEMLFDAHTRSFTALGGITRRGIYDNMKTAVDKVGKGKMRVVNTRFAKMASHYLFDPEFCNRASGWEKGIVEKNVQDARRRMWQDAADVRFASFDEVNAWLLTRCQLLWNELKHPVHEQFTIADVLEQERDVLMPMIPPFDGYVETLGKVSSTCLISIDRNAYSVPCEFAGQIVSLRLYPNRVDVVANDIVVASHSRQFGKNHTSCDWQHYVSLLERKPGALRNGTPFQDMPAPLQQLRQVLLRRSGGDKVMARVLNAARQTSLSEVLVAVELVLEVGAVSAESIENMINRLRQPDAPQPAHTTLSVTEAPLADTGRYDSLRVEGSHA